MGCADSGTQSMPPDALLRAGLYILPGLHVVWLPVGWVASGELGGQVYFGNS